MPITASRKAVARNSGTRKMRILALSVSSSASATAADGQLQHQHRQRQQQRQRRIGLGHAPREEQRQADARIGEQLQARGPFDQRQVAAGILEDQRLVDHGQLEVRGRVVHRHARVLGQRHHGEGHAGEGQARVDREFAVRQRLDDGGRARSSCEISEAENSTISSAGSARKPTSISRRAPSVPNAVPMSIAASEMNTRASANSPTSAIASAAGDSGRSVDSVGHDGAGQQHAAEDDVGRDAEQRRGVLGDHRFLVEQLVQHAVGLQQARAPTCSAARRATG